jgi:transcriptional regulator with GAF, ATPase, and Fis domain
MTTSGEARFDQRPAVAELDEVAGALEALAAALAEEEQLRAVAQRVCEQVVRAVPGVQEASITLLRDGEPDTVAYTSAVCAALDADQYRLGAGPCLDAATSGTVTRVAIDAAAERWPRFAADAAAAGMGSFLCAPIVLEGDHSGAISCYSTHSGGFADLDEQLLQLFIAAAEAALRAFQRYRHARDLAQQLTTAMETRAVIEQAKGAIMAAHGIDADKAFQVLIQQSQTGNVKLRDIAARFLSDLIHTTE